MLWFIGFVVLILAGLVLEVHDKRLHALRDMIHAQDERIRQLEARLKLATIERGSRL